MWQRPFAGNRGEAAAQDFSALLYKIRHSWIPRNTQVTKKQIIKFEIWQQQQQQQQKSDMLNLSEVLLLLTQYVLLKAGATPAINTFS